MTSLDCRVAQGVAEAAGARLDVGQVGVGSLSRIYGEAGEYSA